MAQVVDYYKAETNNTCYGYQYADGSGTKTKFDPWERVTLGANYDESATNGRYYIKSHACWLNWTYVSEITPVYKTITDACTPPTSLYIDTAAKLMTITGGDGGDLNALQGFGIQWRERDIAGTTWGSWSTETVSVSRTVPVDANAGKIRQYQVRTRGSAGESYYSQWVTCSTLFSGNTAPATPTIILPKAEAVTASKTPVVVVYCSADNEGDEMTLKRQINGGSWETVATVAGSGGRVYDQLNLQGNGRYTVIYKLADANGSESSAASVTIVVGAGVWRRSISSGDIISNGSISHVADIHEMLNAVNIQRMYYELNVILLPGVVGRFSDWGSQMQTLLKGTNDCLSAAGQPVTVNEVSDVWPNADTINQIRSRALQV